MRVIHTRNIAGSDLWFSVYQGRAARATLTIGDFLDDEDIPDPQEFEVRLPDEYCERVGSDTNYKRGRALVKLQQRAQINYSEPCYAAHLGQAPWMTPDPEQEYVVIAGPDSFNANEPLLCGEPIAAYRKKWARGYPNSGALFALLCTRVPVRKGIVYVYTSVSGTPGTYAATYIKYANTQKLLERSTQIPCSDSYNYSLADAEHAYGLVQEQHYKWCLSVSNPGSMYYDSSPYIATNYAVTWYGEVPDEALEHAAQQLKRLDSVEEWNDFGNVWGRLSAQVIADYKLHDVDNIENMTQLQGFGDTLRAYIEPIDLTPKGLTLAFSGRLLSSKYGDALTVSDAAELQLAWWHRIMGDWTSGDQTRRASEMHTTWDGITVRYNFEAIAQRNSDPISRAMMFASDRGFLPGLSTVWNLVPYSFVVDWFCNIQEILAGADAQVLRCALWCKKTFSSRKITFQEKRGLADYNYAIYTRSVGSEFPFPAVDFQLEKPSLNQLVTGACLLAQRFLK